MASNNDHDNQRFSARNAAYKARHNKRKNEKRRVQAKIDNAITQGKITLEEAMKRGYKAPY